MVESKAGRKRATEPQSRANANVIRCKTPVPVNLKVGSRSSIFNSTPYLSTYYVGLLAGM